VSNLGIQVDLVPLILLVAAAISVALLVSSLRTQGNNETALIALSGLAGTSGLLLIFLREHMPEWVSILPGNLLVIAAYVALGSSALQKAGRPALPAIVLGSVTGAAFTLAYITDPAALQLRVAIMSVALIAFAVLVIEALMPLRRRRAIASALAILGLAAVLGLLRTLSAMGMLAEISPPDDVDVMIIRLGILATLVLAAIIAWQRWPARKVAAPEPDIPPADDLPTGWRLAQERRSLLTPAGLEVRLTGNEYLVLHKLRSGGEPVARNDLNAIIGRDAENPKDRGVDILISRLRRKCGDADSDLPIVSVRGRGYVFHGELALT
jgi:hypothetical protein